jgi:hypothetical protein
MVMLNVVAENTKLARLTLANILTIFFHKTANNSTATKAREKMSTDFEILEDSSH